MKLIICVAMFTFLSGCGSFQRTITGLTGGLTYKCSKSGVEYVQSDSGIAVHLNQLGIPVKCSNY